jgi:hypothetical protein
VNTEAAARLENDIDGALFAGDLDRAEALADRYCQEAGQEPLPNDADQSPRFRSAYLAGQVALAAGHLQKALDRLAPLQTLTGRLGPELAARVRLFHAEALARLRRGPEALFFLDQVPADFLRRQPLLQLRALRIRLWQGEVTRLRVELDACASALQARGDSANGALLACEEGRAWDAAGDLARAQACWQRADHLSQSLDGDPIRADVLIQLARLDHLRGHLAWALDRFDAAHACAGFRAQRLEIELRRLLVRLDLHQWQQVRAAADHLLNQASVHPLPEEVRPLAGMIQALVADREAEDLTDEVRAFRQARQGNVDAARSLYLEALAAVQSPERQARRALALGLLAWSQDSHAEAQGWLRQAEELARAHDLPELLGEAVQARGEIAAVRDGDDHLARKLFEEAVAIAEVQAAQFGHRLDATTYRQRRGTVLRRLLRVAGRRNDPQAFFRYQELERGRLLLDLWQTDVPRSLRAGFFDDSDLGRLENQIAAAEQEMASRQPGVEELSNRRRTLGRLQEMRLQRDRLLEDYLRNHSRQGSALLPAFPDLADVERILPPRTVFVAPVVLDDDLYLLAARCDRPARVIRGSGSAATLLEAVAQWRGCLTSQMARYEAGLSLGRPERAELDERLTELWRGPLGDALDQALDPLGGRVDRLLWVPDRALHGLPLHALRRRGRYLVQEVEVVWAFSGAQIVHQARTRYQTRSWFRPAVVVTETPAVLPEAVSEGEGVAASFWWPRKLHGAACTRPALSRQLARARVVHFACHSHFDSAHPLAARVDLPSGEKLRALEWLEEPVAGLPLVTLSACRSAEVAPLVGSEVFGLVTALLAAGVRAVLAGLWPVADRPARTLMWRFYRARLTADLGTALAQAQRESLADSRISPLFWAAFALFGDASALPAPGRFWRWFARWRQQRHSGKFGDEAAS